MPAPAFPISIEEPKKDFENHLSVEGNSRILFSAPFGTGKTYFLKEFFANASKYEIIHLYPVNYSVASNEDIFELIKHDILFELLQKDVDIDNTEFSDLFTAQYFLYENAVDIIKPFIENTSELGKSIIPILGSLQKLQKKYLKFRKEVNENDTINAFEFLKKFKNKTGSIYEEDFYTQLIRNLVQQLNETGKETILIIDDLDRIDPEHIFRLLNVFAAHFDHNSSENKFDFSKIIFVTDVANLKSIFSTKYGERTDFSGYLNKFFSLNVFVYDNLKSILENVGKYFNKVLPNNEDTKSVYKFNEDSSRTINYLVIEIIKWLVNNNKITTRSLIKLPERNYYFKNEELKDYYPHTKGSLMIIPILDFVSYVFGSAKLMEQAFYDCSDSFMIEITATNIGIRRLLESTVFILEIRKNKLNVDVTSTTPGRFLYKSGKYDLKVDYVLQGFGEYTRGVHSRITSGLESGVIYPFDILYKTLKSIQLEFYLYKN